MSDKHPRAKLSAGNSRTKAAIHLHTLRHIKSHLRSAGSWYLRKKWVTLPLTILLLLSIVYAIPATRYFALGWFWTETVTIKITDNQNSSTVSAAIVTLDGQHAETNSKGEATLHNIHVGSHILSITKQYYRSFSQAVTVPVFNHRQATLVSLQATGRLANVTINDRITGKPITNAAVTLDETTLARTDQNGTASVVIPAEKQEMAIIIKADAHNDLETTLHQAAENTYALVPSGRLFFLSKLSGKIDVVSTNFDGSDRKTILAGTGTEGVGTTNLLASRDWKYLALLSQREAGQSPNLYLINTSTGRTTEIDQSKNRDLYLIGWSGDHFIYSTNNQNIEFWQTQHSALKSYDATSGKIITLDETTSDGTASWNARFASPANAYIVRDSVIYTKQWQKTYNNYSGTLEGRQSVIFSIHADGTQQVAVQSFPAQTISSIFATAYAPSEILFNVTQTDGSTSQIYEFDDGAIKKSTLDSQTVQNRNYPTYLVSPSGKATLWHDPRDGKNAILTGDKDGNNSTELVNQSDFATYGWYTDDYILLQKNSSELYITTQAQLKAGVSPLKVSDYYKPQRIYPGYGYGYGGI